jgi:hypothetical protein
MRQYELTTMQVHQMLKNCTHIQALDDLTGHRVEGRVPASDTTGTRKISAHVCISKENILVITVINN